MNYQDVIDFWFEKLTPNEWYKKDEILDLKMVETFIALHDNAIKGELFEWRRTPMGRLAEILIIDQFSRNIYRDDPKAFMYDSMALVLSQEAINANIAQELSPLHRQFLYMPFMHSESKTIHEKAVKLFSEPGLEHNLDYEYRHKKVIDRFGRYPHRNKILGRTSTTEELTFLVENPEGF